jgi:hypothetical protein
MKFPNKEDSMVILVHNLKDISTPDDALLAIKRDILDVFLDAEKIT